MIEFYIKTGVENMQIPVVCRLLQNSYWAHDRADVIIEKSMQKSDCYGAFLTKTGQQIGFARIVTDDATFFWLCDVIVDENYRGHGAGKMLMAAIKDNAKYQPMIGILGTRDAHGLYEKYGFVTDNGGRMMRKPKEI